MTSTGNDELERDQQVPPVGAAVLDAPSGESLPDEAQRRALTPRQARRIHIGISVFFMVAMAAGLALRLAQQSSVLVVGVYGLALILCGVVIELSRRGRTRLGMWMMITGVLATIAGDALLLRS
ncbi:hypothetical protein [Streptomyces sp. NPDC048639]|uniref:hypothetical protein n=1 Tax=Streptomyces sp. NPDC048639 TaxID=3365581 RepID=UPI00371D89F9